MLSREDLWQRYRLPLATAALALLLTAIAYAAAAELADRQARERFEFRVHQIHEAVTRRLESYVNVLRSGAGLFDATGHVTREMWRTYVDRLALLQTFPGFQGLGYTARIPAERLAHHERTVRAQGFPDYRVHPDHPRDEYHSIVYLEPFDWRNQRAFGFDMYSEPTRRAAMARARDTGFPAMSGRVTLVQETDEDVQAGFLIYHPVYRRGAPLETVEQRREALLGFVYSPVRVDNLLRGVLGGPPPGVDFVVYDGEPGPERLMYSSHESGAPPTGRFTSVRRIDVAGHQWSLHFVSTPGFEDVVDRWRPALILVVGVAVSALSFMTVRSAQARREGALALLEARREQEAELRRLNAALERRVRERTAALEVANRELEAFAYTVSHDLRAPLRAIGGFSERLRGELGDPLPGKVGHYVARIQAGVARMKQLIDDLLALSRVVRSDLSRVIVDPAAVAREVVRELKAQEPQRRVAVEIETTPLADADARMLRIALENLLGNAWKFTARTPDARIRFGAVGQPGGDHAWFVEDNGAGFDSAHAEQLFRPFQRLHRDDEYPGTGIGLATVHRIVARHGGKIWVDAAPGRGATFFFTLGEQRDVTTENGAAGRGRPG